MLASGADVAAFRYGLERFPALRRVTVTPLAHGHLLFTPLCETPMIRAFPRGFNYYFPRSWRTLEWDGMTPEAEQWSQLSEDKKNRWRGLRIVTQCLTQTQSHSVSELVLDVGTTSSGINGTIFAEPCDEYDSLFQLETCRIPKT